MIDSQCDEQDRARQLAKCLEEILSPFAYTGCNEIHPVYIADTRPPF